MRQFFLFLASLLPLLSMASTTQTKPVEVVFKTTLGEIVMEVYQDKAPKTAAYFLGFVDRGDYTDTAFYRTVLPSATQTMSLVQGGLAHKAMTGEDPNPKPLKDSGLPLLETVETTDQTGLSHQYAMVSFARDLFDSGFVLPEIFICLNDIPKLDAGGMNKPDAKGFPVFAKVIAGMDVVKKISKQQVSATAPFEVIKGQIIAEPVVILSASRK